jgi:Predicted hydrolases or acyltransferases (alpha/beta hydrolase superfamily)
VETGDGETGLTSVETDMPAEARALDAAARITHTKVTGDLTLCWREWGPGSEAPGPATDLPLVLLHGAQGNWMHWLRNIPALAARRRLLAPDLPGLGDSGAPADLDSAADHARALIEGLRQIVPAGAVDMLAFSLGSTLACHMSVLEPELARRIVLIGSGGLGTPHTPPPVRQIRGAPADQLDAINRHNLGVLMIHDPARVDQTAIAINAYGGRRARTRLQHHVMPDKLLSTLRKVPVPIDVIWAEHDALHPGPEVNFGVIRAFQPQARLRAVEDAGHWCMYEQPERFNRAALDLLNLPLHAGPVCQ